MAVRPAQIFILEALPVLTTVFLHCLCDELNTATEPVGASGIAYSDYASVDDAVVTSGILSVDDIVAECADPCDSDEEVEEKVERITQPMSSSAVAALDLLQRYVRVSDDGESYLALQVTFRFESTVSQPDASQLSDKSQDGLSSLIAAAKPFIVWKAIPCSLLLIQRKAFVMNKWQHAHLAHRAEGLGEFTLDKGFETCSCAELPVLWFHSKGIFHKES
ncbi:hypothetical protein HPB51_029085 [Rhipicephalus microplus]|uniref:Secreted protein n=1 Tax=Rhipicephalus microplus TaxID=6941 RepID=A0A9J6CV47_RHIMP|nr:hypothetical protein HPB51_029085 [Rhipicephalus microplus]